MSINDWLRPLAGYVRLSLSSPTRINPFDIPQVVDTEEADNALRSNLITLHGLLRLMMGGASAQAMGNNIVNTNALTPSEEADLDAALIETYAKAGITNDPLTHTAQPPTITDLYDTLPSYGRQRSSVSATLTQVHQWYICRHFLTAK